MNVQELRRSGAFVRHLVEIGDRKVIVDAYLASDRYYVETVRTPEGDRVPFFAARRAKAAAKAAALRTLHENWLASTAQDMRRVGK